MVDSLTPVTKFDRDFLIVHAVLSLPLMLYDALVHVLYFVLSQSGRVTSEKKSSAINNELDIDDLPRASSKSRYYEEVVIPGTE